MRLKERIPIIWEVLKSEENRKKVLEYWFKPTPGTQMKLDDPYHYLDVMLEGWKVNYVKLLGFWERQQDLRLSQLLVNSGIIPNHPGSWYHVEDEVLMTELSLLEPRDIYFWGKNFDKDGNQLEETQFVLAKDMDTDHILNILFDVLLKKYSISNKYIEMFINEVKLRQDGKT